MEYVDIEKWPRRSHFEFFENADDAFIDVTVQLDITTFFSYVHNNGFKFFPSLLFCFLKAMNEIEEFRVRHNIPKNKTWLMPAGDNREELIKQYPISLEKAFEMGYNWTGRDHIISYDTKRAV